jgi:predicted nucleic acid-binding protein
MADICYWDSACLLGWLNAEEDKVDECEQVLDLADRRKLQIAVSAITFAEVVHIKGYSRLEQAKQKAILDFFYQPYISVRDVDSWIGRLAQELMWKHEALRAYDAIHLATAIHYKIEHVHTFDQGLLALNGLITGYTLRIVKPGQGLQMQLKLDEAAQK